MDRTRNPLTITVTDGNTNLTSTTSEDEDDFSGGQRRRPASFELDHNQNESISSSSSPLSLEWRSKIGQLFDFVDSAAPRKRRKSSSTAKSTSAGGVSPATPATPAIAAVQHPAGLLIFEDPQWPPEKLCIRAPVCLEQELEDRLAKMTSVAHALRQACLQERGLVGRVVAAACRARTGCVQLVDELRRNFDDRLAAKDRWLEALTTRLRDAERRNAELRRRLDDAARRSRRESTTLALKLDQTRFENVLLAAEKDAVGAQLAAAVVDAAEKLRQLTTKFDAAEEATANFTTFFDVAVRRLRRYEDETKNSAVKETWNWGPRPPAETAMRSYYQVVERDGRSFHRRQLCMSSRLSRSVGEVFGGIDAATDAADASATAAVIHPQPPGVRSFSDSDQLDIVERLRRGGAAVLVPVRRGSFSSKAGVAPSSPLLSAAIAAAADGDVDVRRGSSPSIVVIASTPSLTERHRHFGAAKSMSDIFSAGGEQPTQPPGPPQSPATPKPPSERQASTKNRLSRFRNFIRKNVLSPDHHSGGSGGGSSWFSSSVDNLPAALLSRSSKRKTSVPTPPQWNSSATITMEDAAVQTEDPVDVDGWKSDDGGSSAAAAGDVFVCHFCRRKSDSAASYWSAVGCRATSLVRRCSSRKKQRRSTWKTSSKMFSFRWRRSLHKEERVDEDD